MDCPNCGRPVDAGQAFCGECGARVEVSPPAPEPVAPTQPMSPAPPAAPAYNDAAYQQQYTQQAQYQQPGAQPGYQQQYAQQAQYQQQYAQPGYQQQYVQPTQPKKKTGLIIGVAAAVFVVVVGLAVGGFFIFKAMSDKPPTSSGTSATTSTPGTSTDTPPVTSSDGYASPEEALAAEYPSDWVFTLQYEEADYKGYWVGPPNSEYVDEVIVEQTIDGYWLVTEIIPLGDLGDMLPEDEAVNTVIQFLDLIMQDRPLEAQQLCVPPFSEDAASAQYSNGDFLSYDILGVTVMDDGTYWVHTSEEWRWGTDEWEYWVVPTELGYYISELRPYSG